MSDDLVKRLRSMEVFFMDGCISPVAYAAADRIEELEAALHRIEENADQFSMQWAAEIARAALKGETE
jgi:hypothetical protein